MIFLANNFLIKNCCTCLPKPLQIPSYVSSLTSTKYIQAPEEAFNPTENTLNIFSFFSFLGGQFWSAWIRISWPIWTRNLDPDRDPKHCLHRRQLEYEENWLGQGYTMTETACSGTCMEPSDGSTGKVRIFFLRTDVLPFGHLKTICVLIFWCIASRVIFMWHANNLAMP